MDIARIVARCLWEEQRLLQTATSAAQVQKAIPTYVYTLFYHSVIKPLMGNGWSNGSASCRMVRQPIPLGQ